MCWSHCTNTQVDELISEIFESIAEIDAPREAGFVRFRNPRPVGERDGGSKNRVDASTGTANTPALGLIHNRLQLRHPTVSMNLRERTMSAKLPPHVELMRELVANTFSGTSSTRGPA